MSYTAEEFETVHSIGRGSFAEVVLVKHKSTGQHFAIKCIQSSKCKQLDVRREENILLHFAEQQASSTSPVCVRLHGTFNDPLQRTFNLVMDFHPYGALERVLRKLLEVQKTLEFKLVQHWCAEVALALDFIHSRHVLYRDLKPENILVNEDGHLVLADFGLSKQVDPEDMVATSVLGTPLYVAPELMLGWAYGNGVDWWSFGIFCFRLMFGEEPFRSRADLRLAVLQEPIDFNRTPVVRNMPTELFPQAQNLLRKLLTRNPSSRLRNFELIKDHPFFAGVDWDEVASRAQPVPMFKETVAALSK